MAEASFNFFIDWDNDGDFDEADEDISSSVMKATWNVGMKTPFQDTADESRAVMTLKNTDRRFSPVEYFTRVREQFDPIVHYRLNETSGTIANDNSGNGLNVVIDSATLNKPGIGDGFTSMEFDGVSDFINIFSTPLESLWTPAETTIIIWVKHDNWTTLNSERALVIAGLDVAGNIIDFQLTGVAGEFRVRRQVSGGANLSITQTGISGTDWHMAALTVSESNTLGRFYWDGVQVGGDISIGTWEATDLNNTLTIIGSQNTTPTANRLWVGNLAHGMIFNGAFTKTNIADLFSLHITRSARVLGRRARIESVLNGETIEMWNGWIDDVTPSTDVSRQFISNYDGVGPKRFIQDQEVFIPIMLETTADEVITELLSDIETPPLEGTWRLGLVGSSELGVNTTLGTKSIPLNIETGQITFAYAGDNWQDSTTVYEAIKSTTESERGKFYFDRGGTAVFWNNQHWQLADETVDQFQVVQGLEYTFGNITQNIIEVNYADRIEGSDSIILWKSPNDISLAANEIKNFNARFKGSASEDLGGTVVITPNTGDGSFVFSGAIELGFVVEGRVANIELRETAGNAGTVTTLQILGKPITSNNKILQISNDPIESAIFGERIFKIQADLIDNYDDAKTIGDFELNRRKVLRGEALSITLVAKNETIQSKILNRLIGDRITVIDSHLLLRKDYLVIGESHTIEAGKDGLPLHFVTWYLEPATVGSPWILGTVGRSELGIATVLGF